MSILQCLPLQESRHHVHGPHGCTVWHHVASTTYCRKYKVTREITLDEIADSVARWCCLTCLLPGVLLVWQEVLDDASTNLHVNITRMNVSDHRCGMFMRLLTTIRVFQAFSRICNLTCQPPSRLFLSRIHRRRLSLSQTSYVCHKFEELLIHIHVDSRIWCTHPPVPVLHCFNIIRQTIISKKHHYFHTHVDVQVESLMKQTHLSPCCTAPTPDAKHTSKKSISRTTDTCTSRMMDQSNAPVPVLHYSKASKRQPPSGLDQPPTSWCLPPGQYHQHHHCTPSSEYPLQGTTNMHTSVAMKSILNVTHGEMIRQGTCTCKCQLLQLCFWKTERRS